VAQGPDGEWATLLRETEADRFLGSLEEELLARRGDPSVAPDAARVIDALSQAAAMLADDRRAMLESLQQERALLLTELDARLDRERSSGEPSVALAAERERALLAREAELHEERALLQRQRLGMAEAGATFERGLIWVAAQQQFMDLELARRHDEAALSAQEAAATRADLEAERQATAGERAAARADTVTHERARQELAAAAARVAAEAERLRGLEHELVSWVQAYQREVDKEAGRLPAVRRRAAPSGEPPTRPLRAKREA
jgi:hypothetical protein